MEIRNALKEIMKAIRQSLAGNTHKKARAAQTVMIMGKYRPALLLPQLLKRF